MSTKEDEPYTYYWAEHPRYPSADWRYEIANGDTREGYWEWCSTRAYQERQLARTAQTDAEESPDVVVET